MRPYTRLWTAVALVASLGAAACGADNTSAEAASASGAEGLADGESGPDGEATPAGNATVDRIIDGDSVELLIDGQIVEARLIGINAPELADCQGPAATDALAGIAEDQLVDVTEFGDDRFGRRLVELTIADESVNFAMVRTGWALGQHTDDHRNAEKWVSAMEDAAVGGLGMWDMSTECPPTGGVVIVEVEADPAGPDDDVLEDEWILIENETDAAVDLEGWALRDESTSNRFVFDSVQIGAGDTLRIRTGCGTDTNSDIHWCSPNGVWSNEGETAMLLGPSGSIESWVIID